MKRASTSWISIVLLLAFAMALPTISAQASSTDWKIENPYATGGNAYKIQLHGHSTNSDGQVSPPDYFALHKADGYDGAILSDHDFVTPNPGVPGILYISGVEETDNLMSGDWGHMNRFGVSADSISTNPQNIINDTHTEGGERE